MGTRRAPEPPKRKTYNQDERDYWMGQLMASAVNVGGQWVPNFHAVAVVAGKDGPHRKSLQRWWDERNPAGDAQLRAASTRGLEEQAAKGGADWFQNAYERLRRVVDIVIDDSNYAHTGSVETESGKIIHQGGRFADARPDSIARGAKLVAETLPMIEKRLGLDDTDEGDKPKTVNEHIRDAERRARNAGLIK